MLPDSCPRRAVPDPPTAWVWLGQAARRSATAPGCPRSATVTRCTGGVGDRAQESNQQRPAGVLGTSSTTGHCGPGWGPAGSCESGEAWAGRAALSDPRGMPARSHPRQRGPWRSPDPATPHSPWDCLPGCLRSTGTPMLGPSLPPWLARWGPTRRSLAPCPAGPGAWPESQQLPGTSRPLLGACSATSTVRVPLLWGRTS